MGIGTGGINGGYSGKAGSLVGYYRMGKWIVRGMPKLSKKNKVGTVAQKASRSTFTKMQHFLSPIIAYVRVGFNMDGRLRQMTAHNAAKSHNMLNAFTPEGDIDYSKVLISFGKLPGALNPTVEKDDVGFHFAWTDNSKEKFARGDDQIILLAYDVETPIEFGMLSGARRNAGTETITIHSQMKGNTFHLYMAFISDDRMRISTSMYLGEIVY